MKTEDKNRIILEFLGAKKDDVYMYNIDGIIPREICLTHNETKVKIDKVYLAYYAAKFNSDWNWLFIAVKYLKDLQLDAQKFDKLDNAILAIDIETAFNEVVNIINDIDLFEHINILPNEVKAVIEKYADIDNTYDECAKFLGELVQLGYSFDYYLDAVPYKLRRLPQ